MKLVEMKCKNCGSILKVEDDAKNVTCKYCNTTFAIDDEIQHVKYDDMYESGYEFEKGRIKAQKEAEDIEDDEEGMPDELKNTITKSFKTTGIFMSIFTIIFIALFISVFVFIAYQAIHINDSITSDDTWSSFKFPSTDFSESQKSVDNEFEKRSFNNKFERYTGTKNKFWINSLLDDVITNNKTNSEHLITVIYNESVTDSPDQIVNIKHTIVDGKDYEVLLDYNEDGFINKVTIMDL